MSFDHQDHHELFDRPQGHHNGPHSQFANPAGPNHRSALGWLGIVLAWLVILAILVLRFATPEQVSEPAGVEGSDQSTSPSEPLKVEESAQPKKLVLDRKSRISTVLQGRYLVGANELLPGFDAQALQEASRGLQQGSLGERLGYVTVIGAIGSSDDAETALTELEQEVHRAGYVPTAQEADVLKALHQVYSSSAAPLTQQQQEMLVDQLGWFGSLALATGPGVSASPKQRDAVLQQAHRTILIAGTFGILAVGGCFLGLIGLILVIVFVCTGRIRSGLSLVNTSVRFNGISVEAFAVWLLWFIFLQWLVGVVAKAAQASSEGALLLSAAAFIISIGGLLGWALLRGFRWQTICQQSGLHVGRSFWFEVMWGILGYVMALPIVVVGLILTLILMQLSLRSGIGDGGGNPFQPIEEPLHPINLMMVGADVWRYLTIVLVGSVCAPIVEELAFRGMFYRHLRGATWRWNMVLSILISTLVTAFIFAAIHPQGWVTIPMLMALAIAFALLREWRGSLVAPMVAHALSNFLVLTFGILLLN